MSWKKALANVAPVLASVIGGPQAGTAVNFIAKTILGKDKATEAEIEDFILNASPEQLAAIKKAEFDFKVRMEELGVKTSEIAVDNTKDARKLGREKGIAPHVILSVVFIFGFFYMLWLLFGGGVELNDTVRDSALVLLGVLGTNVTLIMKFWFGGSPNDETNMSHIYNSTPR